MAGRVLEACRVEKADGVIDDSLSVLYHLRAVVLRRSRPVGLGLLPAGAGYGKNFRFFRFPRLTISEDRLQYRTRGEGVTLTACPFAGFVSGRNERSLTS